MQTPRRELWSRYRASFALFRYDELEEPEPLCAAGIPMRMHSPGRSEQAVSGVQSDRFLALLLPDPRAGNDPKRDRRWMEGARVHGTPNAFRVPDDHLLRRLAHRPHPHPPRR